VSVNVSYLGLRDVVRFRVWFPVSLEVLLRDRDLGVVADSSSQRSSHSDTYQQSKVYAKARFSAGGTSHYEVYVTSLMSFRSSNSSVATVSGSTVTGVGVGSALIGVSSVSSSVEVKPASVLVGQSVAKVVSLDVIAITGASATGTGTGSSVSPYGTVYPSYSLEQSLSAEGDAADIFAYVNFDDGSYMDVSSSVHVLSSSAYLRIAQSGSGSGNQAVVAVGAQSVSGGLLLGRWSCCGFNVTGTGLVKLVMPSAVSVAVTASSSRLTRPGDLAHSSPYSVPISSTLSVSVVYADGSTKSFTSPSLDSRVAVTVESGGDSVYVIGNVVYTNGSAAAAAAAAAATAIPVGVVLKVSFPDLYALSGSLTLSVVVFSYTKLSLSPYPSVSSYSSNLTVLHRVGCTDSFQRATVTVTGYLTDGSQSDLTASSTVSSSSRSVAYLAGAVLVGRSVGLTTISSNYSSFSSNSVLLTITSTATSIASVRIQSSNFPSSTFNGVLGSTRALLVSVYFDDFTVYSDVVSGVSSGWVKASDLLTLASSASGAISANSTGVLTLRGNYFQAVTVTASSKCSSRAVNGSLNIYANLKAAELDVDLGSSTGLQFPQISVGESFVAEVRVMGGASDITSFQVVVSFNASMLQVQSDSSCVVGSGWKSLFECTTNNPVDEVLVAGGCGLLPSSSCDSSER